MKILSDTTRDSPRANHMRGYHDYERLITFEDNVSSEECKKYLDTLKTPYDMWFHYAQMKSIGNVWRITYGYDSGD